MLGTNEGSFGDELEREIGLLLREQKRQEANDRERELNIYRSGSAPPTVEGSLSAVGGLFGGGGGGGGVVSNHGYSEFSGGKNGTGFASEEELRSDPAYHSYYYSNVNLNPRLPPPLLSKEDWKFAQRLNGGSSGLGGIGDRRKVNRPENGRALYSMPPGFDSSKPVVETEKVHGSAAEWGNGGLIGLSGIGLGNKQKSLAEIFQDDLGQQTTVIGRPSRPASCTRFDENSDLHNSAEAELAALLHQGLASSDASRSSGQGLASSDASRSKGQSSSGVQKIGSPSYTYAAALGNALSRGNTPDPQIVARAPSPCLTPIGGERAAAAEKRPTTNSHSFNNIDESANLAGAFSGMNLSANGAVDGEKHDQDYLFALENSRKHKKPQTPVGEQHMQSSLHSPDNGPSMDSGADIGKGFFPDRQVELPKSVSAFRNPSFKLKGSPTTSVNGEGNYPAQYHQLMDNSNSSYANYGLGGFYLDGMAPGQVGANNLPPLYENVIAASAMGIPGTDSRILGYGRNLDAASESSNLNRMAGQMSGSPLQTPYMDPMYLQYMRANEYPPQVALNSPSADRNCLGNPYLDLLEMQKAYLGSMLSPPKAVYNRSLSGKSRGSNGYYGNQAYGAGMSYPGSPMANQVLPNSPGGPGSPLRANDYMRLSPGMRNVVGGLMGNWQLDGNESFGSSLLEEFKSNKTKCFELSEIAGHVVEFSADQFGSRFIQQKLETATVEEKNMVYQEIMPKARELMTDVFGNYVIQKFFEHGLPSQRRELAGKLYEHVLELSLQMYGCRVIQKAIEVVDLDQKIKMVEELDGSILRCVRDQNGNHVIQKCIECVPEEAIYFIVSDFFNQVVSLSTHPYGCRVIQRVLEHCEDPNTQSKVMEEIMGSVSMLAQDQYGNYVIQHVLEHGNPHERSTIIEELTGKIVEMSQQKFASNVVEKCLAFGSAAQRQLMVDEMLGLTDENEPLQAMMKDQFANYVVQKVLETCDDHQRELILTRIKIHLNALKKYTYGKHIVARVEKLVAAGERRMGQSHNNERKEGINFVQTTY